MKFLLPCPACQHPLSPPRQASSSAQLRCPHCGHSLVAQSILVENDQLDGAWEVIEDTGTENAFAAFHESTSLEAAPSSLLGVEEIQESPALVPHSNEWETQPSAIVFDESIETDAEFQIANDHGSDEGFANSDVPKSELESFDDRMMDVSEEPNFSPISETQSALEEDTSDILISDTRDQQNDLVDYLEQEETLEFDLSDDAMSFEESVTDSNSLTNAMARRKSSSQPEFESEESFELQELVEPIQSKEPPALDLLGTSKMRPRARKKSSPIKTLFSIVGGGMAAIPISILLLWNGVKTIGIEPMDPFEVGPLIAKYVPWIVPENFRGIASSNSRRLPTIPFTPESSIANESSHESRKFPPIGGDSRVSQPSIEPEPSLPVTLSEPSMSTTPSESSLSLSTIPAEPSLLMPATATTELADTSLVLSTPGEPAMAPRIDAVSILPSNDSMTDEEKFDQTLAEFDSAITHFSEDKPATAASVFHKLETLGEIIAAERAPSLKKAAWKLKATKCCETIIANPKLFVSLKGYLASDRSELFPDDIEILKPTISADYVQIDSIIDGEDQVEWVVTKRAATKILPPLMVFVPQSLEIKARSKEVYLVVGIVEEDIEMKKHVFRVLFAGLYPQMAK